MAHETQNKTVKKRFLSLGFFIIDQKLSLRQELTYSHIFNVLIVFPLSHQSHRYRQTTVAK